MSGSRTLTGFILFDSAIVPLDRIVSIIDDGYPGHCLYADWGEEAKSVSPWLLAPSSRVAELVRDLREGGQHAHGVSRLATSASADAIVLHLRRLQTMFADRKRYYLRYADARAFSDLWSVLDPAQRRALLGPIAAWEASAAGESSRYIDPDDGRTLAQSVTLPLRLSSRQFGELLRAQRDTQRWSIWLKTQPQLCEGYSPAELRKLSRLTGEWLRAQGALPERVVQAVGVAVLRSGGEVLGHPEFADKARHGAVGDPVPRKHPRPCPPDTHCDKQWTEVKEP
ncbi:DUF4123 domain-containing protein [Xanthomonas massiliensis]|uniref:DUF4123 domain-containing protein n=1 Tax=Xanthomonas massiliensis TaxID=1720302 RepID=UPI0008271C73|nr:DUF4123 domain-containing protein [Xanthomonas massiliensis]